MSFDKLNKYKQQVKAVQRKPSELEPVLEILPEKSERKTILLNSPIALGSGANGIGGDGSNTPVDSQTDQQGATVQPGPGPGPGTASPVVAKPTKDDIKFNESDSEKNIIFMDQKELKTLQSELDPSAAVPVSETPQIKGATIYKLIERATTEKYADPNLLTDFLLTFRSFTTPSALLNLLIRRYHMPVPKDLSYGELQEFKQNTLRPIRLRLINFLKTWLEKYWKDFIEDPEMGAKLHEFLVEDVVNTGFQSFAEQLSKAWEKKRSNPEQDRNTFVFNETPPKPILPKLNKGGSSNTLGLMDFHPEELARQLTLVEFNLYRNIKPWEFFNQAWTRKNKATTSPNVLRMIQRFNEVSTWVSTEIVKAEKMKDRTAVLSKFLEVADKCRTLNNFNAIMEIISGLQSSSVFRLRQTWNGLSSKQKELFEELKELMSRAHNFAKLRKYIKSCNPPLIPYLGLYLTDLTFIEDGNPDLIEGGLINWVKRRRLANVIKDIQQYQQKPYCLEEVTFIQDYLMTYIPLTEDEAYKLSLQRETRTPEKEPKKSLFSKSIKKETKESKPSTPPTNSPKEQKNNNNNNTKVPASKPVEEDDTEEEEEFEIQYKAGYKFYDKDSEHNIFIEKDPKGEANDVIKAGTLPKLVERLTYEKYPDMNYSNAFLLTFRTFMTQHEFLDLLQMRYHIPPPVNQTPELLEKFKQAKETPIQLRVFNVCKMWVDKHFDDFREDRTLRAKLVEFIEKSMISSPNLSRAGYNLKAQITVKLESKDEKKDPMFNNEAPEPILPSVENPKLLDYHPEELARQLTLIDYELFTSIKRLEYLYLSKPSSWVMNAEESTEEEPDNLKNSPHVVAVIYRFTDIRDWVATEVMKMDNKEGRAKVIEHFIQVAQKCVALNNFHTFVSIVSALNLDHILALKSTWKLLPKLSLDTFVQLRDLMSYRNNYKALRDKLSSISNPAIPYIGLYVQDVGSIKEQMPDTVEPGSLINFSKRQKMALLIEEIFNFQQTPYNLKAIVSIQDFLKQLDIYAMEEMKILSEQYQEADGDKDITEDIFAKQLENKDPRSNSASKLPDLKLINGLATIGKNSPSPRSSVQNLASLLSGEQSPTRLSPRPSVSNGSGNLNLSGSIPQLDSSQEKLGQVPATESQTNETVNTETPTKASEPGVQPQPCADSYVPNLGTSSPASSPPTAQVQSLEVQPASPVQVRVAPASRAQTQTSPVQVTTAPAPAPAPAPTSAPAPTPAAPAPTSAPASTPASSVQEQVPPASPAQTQTSPVQVTPAPAPAPAPTSAPAPALAPTPASNPSSIPSTVEQPQSLDAVDQKLLKVFPGAKVSGWKAVDTQGIVYGWSGEEITAKLITRNTDNFLVPLFSSVGNPRIDKPELAIIIRVAQFYESQTKQKPTKVIAFTQQLADTVRPISTKLGVQVILSPP